MSAISRESFLEAPQVLDSSSHPVAGIEIELVRNSNKAAAVQFDDIFAPEMQIKARADLVKSYPARFRVEDGQRSWQIALENYKPVYFVHPRVLEKDSGKDPKGWAEPEDIFAATFQLKKLNDPVWSNRADIQLDSFSGRPLNPAGRTGIEGRGLLGLWGPNFAVDNVVVYQDPETNIFNALVIQREDGTWAFPGGMVDRGEKKEVSLPRELKEEAGITLGDSSKKEIFSGFCDDPRNTDNAWMETTAYLFKLDSTQALKLKPHAGSDAKSWKWLPLTPDSIKDLYASHPWIAQIAMRELKAN